MLRAASIDGKRGRSDGRYSIRREVERLDLTGVGLLVEAAPGLGAVPAAGDQLFDDGRKREGRLLGGSEPRCEVARHRGKDVDAGEIHRPERGALRTADGGPGDRVDLRNRQSRGLHRLEDLHQAVDAQPVGDESRRVLRDDHALAEPPVGELDHRPEDGRVGVGSRDHFEQRQVSRRIEEMRPQPAFPEGVAAAFGYARDRDARRVGRDDGRGRGLSFDAFDQRLLDVEPFDDRFDDPVARSQPAQVVERAGADERAPWIW